MHSTERHTSNLERYEYTLQLHSGSMRAETMQVCLASPISVPVVVTASVASSQVSQDSVRILIRWLRHGLATAFYASCQGPELLGPFGDVQLVTFMHLVYESNCVRNDETSLSYMVAEYSTRHEEHAFPNPTAAGPGLGYEARRPMAHPY